VARLRAALGVLRTLFTVGVVSRFTEAMTLPMPMPQQMGYLEHHRLVVHWMVYQAENHAKDNPNKLAPFYRDEMVWLYNEAGLFAMAQGKTDEAAPFFRKAIQANQRIEGMGGGTMYRRLVLNDALCMVDRGQLNEARGHFKLVRDVEEEELLLRMIATGFLGLVDHLGGRMEAAEKNYSTALRQLSGIGRQRSVSYFRRSFADLLRKLNRIPEAKKQLELAILAAESGGYMDFVHFAHLSDARLHLAEDEDAQELIPQLARAEAYAELMDMPRLRGDVLRTRAEILLRQNETDLAADLAAKALRIANLSGLVLRRINYMELLSRIYRRQGDIAAADKLSDWAARSARYIGYASMMYRIDEQKGERYNLT